MTFFNLLLMNFPVSGGIASLHILSFTVACLLFFALISLNRLIRSGLKPHIEWQDQIVCVTGGSSGLGGLISNLLAGQGVTVVVLDIIKPEFSHCMFQAGRVLMADNIVYYECDVADYKQVEETVQRIKQEVGIVSILVNNAGVLVRKPLLEQTHEEIRRVIDVNLFGHFNTLKAFLPDMKKLPYSHIVSISSAIGTLGLQYLTSYAASKAALFTLHESLMVELPPSIHKTLFIFGQLSTPMFAEVETPNKLVAPVVEGITAAKKVVQVIKDGRGGEYSLPLYVNFMGLMRVLPAGIVRIARWWSGGDIAALGRKKSLE